MKFQDLSGKKIAIWGRGKEGIAVYNCLKEKTTPKEIIFIEEENVCDLYDCDVLIKSPGVSLYRKEIKKAKEKGIYCTSASNLFFKNKAEKTKVLAVTGTKGKSTTSSLLYHTLSMLGLSVKLGGNIGTPLIELIDETPDYVIAEMSSYQAADLKGDIEIAILTNLYHEHIQWHLTHEQYYSDKINLLNQSKISVINGVQPESLAHTAHLNRCFFNHEDSIHFKDGFFYDKTKKLFQTSTLSLKGAHNFENATAVLTVLNLLKIDPMKAKEAFSTFKSLPHRLQILGEKDGVLYVDDSISTTPETSLAAVKAFDNNQFITLFIGGFDREQDYTGLIDFLKQMKDRLLLICLPDTGFKAFSLAQKEGINAINTDTIKKGVQIAKEKTPTGGTVILSPGAPSYNQYKNFEERGLDFKKNIFDT